MLTLAGLLALQASTLETSLDIRVTGPSGEPACVTRAALVFAPWGGVHVVELPAGGDRVRVPLHASDEAAAPHVDFATILIEAEGLAPLQSDPFAWTGQRGVPPVFLPREGSDPHAIAFPCGVDVRPVEGDVVSLELRLRAERPRMLRLVDDGGAPVEGVRVTIQRWLSGSNHCGRIIGEMLAARTSDAEGAVEIPDGDFVYAVAVEKPHHVLANPGRSDYPIEHLGRLDAAWTTLVLHRMERRDLSLRIHRDGRPAAGVDVAGCLSGCLGGVCDVCCGLLGSTDLEGRLDLVGFHPEEYDKIHVRLDGDTGWAQQGDTAWEVDPATLEGTFLDVELPSVPPRGP